MDGALILDSLPSLMWAAVVTLQLTAGALLIGTIIALPLGILASSSRIAVAFPVRAYSLAFRGTPLLVQIFLIYYGLGQIEVVRQSVAWPILREPFWCATIALSLNSAGYTAEVLRGAIRAVPRGTVEAAMALGLSRKLTLLRVVLPQAFRLALPAYGNEAILVLKASSLASTITVLELTGTARTLVARTFAPYEIFLAAALVYLALNLVLTALVRRAEISLSRHSAPLGTSRKDGLHSMALTERIAS